MSPEAGILLCLLVLMWFGFMTFILLRSARQAARSERLLRNRSIREAQVVLDTIDIKLEDSKPDIKLEDSLPSPAPWLIEVAKPYLVAPGDRPWLLAPYPIGFRTLRVRCSCSGRFSYIRYEVSLDKGGVCNVWLGQCTKCETIYWGEEK